MATAPYPTNPAFPQNPGKTLVRHEIYTSNVSIPRFCGDYTKIAVDTLLNLVDNHIANKQVQEDKIKFEVFKQYSNNENGEARHVIKL